MITKVIINEEIIINNQSIDNKIIQWNKYLRIYTSTNKNIVKTNDKASEKRDSGECE